jgi:hypothetical protein
MGCKLRRLLVFRYRSEQMDGYGKNHHSNARPSGWRRIASPELLPDFASLPHVICSRARSSCGGDDEAGEHDNTQ